MDFDIAVYSPQGPYVAISRADTAAGVLVVQAVPMASRKYECIRNAIALMIARAQHVWGCDVIERVHGDLEQGLLRTRYDLAEAGIRATFTQGYDPRSNGRAENAVHILSTRARGAMMMLMRNGTSDNCNRALWPFAMAFAAYDFNVQQQLKHKTANPKDAPLPFGSLVIASLPPAKDKSKVEPRGFLALALYPSLETSGGTL